MFTPSPLPTCAVETPVSLYKPSLLDTSDDTEEESNFVLHAPKDKLNEYLGSRDISPIRYQLRTPWETTSSRTKRYHTRKAKQIIDAALKEIAPQDTDKLWTALAKSQSGEKDGSQDTVLLDLLKECYMNADHWSTRRQILSIMADKVPFEKLRKWIPGITRYRFNVARHHQVLHGRGSPVPVPKYTRMYVTNEQLDHFLDFITSGHIMQDLPFGQKKLKLSTNEEISVPNVIRTIIPERIIQQYQAYCEEIDFKPMGRSTLHRILKVCSASTRKSLQGLDNFSADGAKAFDELEDVAEKLGDSCGLGLSWSKEKKEELKVAKRYLKGDYKVRNNKDKKRFYLIFILFLMSKCINLKKSLLVVMKFLFVLTAGACVNELHRC